MSLQINLGVPSEKQKIFLRDTHSVVIFGGARGGGKSFGVRYKTVAMCLKYAGISCLIVRASFPELESNHITPLKKLLHIGEKGNPIKYNSVDKIFRFPNGSTIKLDYCSCDKDLTHFQGREFDIICIDEATNLTEKQIKEIRACNRGIGKFPRRMYLTCNPGGQGMYYIKRLIERKFEEGEDPDDYSFIQSLLTDNPKLQKEDPQYIKRLMALPYKVRQAWLEGRWDVYEGVFFSEFRTTPDPQECYDAGITTEEALDQHRWTHVIKPFEIPSHWKIYRSYDWGYGRPFSCAWTAVDEEGTAYRILELYGCTQSANEGVRWSNATQMDKIQEIEREHRWLKGKKIRGVADPSIWDKSHGPSAAEEADKHQLWFDPGNNNRIQGWMQVHERMKFDENGYAMLYFFENCKAIIRTMPLMMHDEHKPEDLDTELEDHACDDLRYFCMMRPIAPRIIEEKEKPMYDPLNQFGDERLGKVKIYRR